MQKLPAIQTIIFTPEQLETIENMAACNYTISQIATYLSIDKKLLQTEYQDESSVVRHHYDKGILVAQFEINNKLLENAKSGNITAAQIFEKNKDKLIFENHKMRILNEV